MSRNHIHMAIGLPGANNVISGMRRSSDLVFEINLTLAMLQGKKPIYIRKQCKIKPRPRRKRNVSLLNSYEAHLVPKVASTIISKV